MPQPWVVASPLWSWQEYPLMRCAQNAGYEALQSSLAPLVPGGITARTAAEPGARWLASVVIFTTPLAALWLLADR